MEVEPLETSFNVTVHEEGHGTATQIRARVLLSLRGVEAPNKQPSIWVYFFKKPRIDGWSNFSSGIPQPRKAAVASALMLAIISGRVTGAPDGLLGVLRSCATDGPNGRLTADLLFNACFKPRKEHTNGLIGRLVD